VGRAAEALGLDKAFDELGLQKVSAEVFADNEAALKAQAAAGFRREGYLRRHALKDGQFRDVVLLAILAEEWGACRARVRKILASAQLIAA
jgi:RimJ/RimL family protein N-acetyltransferase